MIIGFDAKRAFCNETGLGHYSRNLISALAKYFPDNHYVLFSPSITGLFPVDPFSNISTVGPSGFLNRFFSGFWRSNTVKKEIKAAGCSLFHGLSHEIPINIQKTGVPAVVTIHDLIHERFPEQYPFTDRWIYSKKFRYACANAHHVIAVSEQTRRDIISMYGIPAEKITVCYQNCLESFRSRIADEERQEIRKRYRLPERYLLYVGSVIERKNLLTLVRALHFLKQEVKYPLVVIGKGGTYLKKVQQFLQDAGMTERVIFLSYRHHRISSADFPAIYQMADMLIYPSVFEGFGIPVLEGLCSRIPVITSPVSSLPEAGGNAAFYADPNHAESIADQIRLVLSDPERAAERVEEGWRHAQHFTAQKTAAAVYKVYQKIVQPT